MFAVGAECPGAESDARFFVLVLFFFLERFQRKSFYHEQTLFDRNQRLAS